MKNTAPRANSITAFHLWSPSAASPLPIAILKLLLWGEPPPLSSETANGWNVKSSAVNSCLGGRVSSFTQWKMMIKVEQHLKITCWPVIPISLPYILIFIYLPHKQATELCRTANGTREEVVIVLGGFLKELMMANNLSHNDWGTVLVSPFTTPFTTQPPAPELSDCEHV